MYMKPRQLRRSRLKKRRSSSTQRGGMLRRFGRKVKNKTKKVIKSIRKSRSASPRSDSYVSIPMLRGEEEKDDEEGKTDDDVKDQVNLQGDALPKEFTVSLNDKTININNVRRHLLRTCPKYPHFKNLLPVELHSNILSYYPNWHLQDRYIDLNIFGYAGAAVSEHDFFRYVVNPYEYGQFYPSRDIKKVMFTKVMERKIIDNNEKLVPRKKCLVKDTVISGVDDDRHRLFVEDISHYDPNSIPSEESNYLHAYKTKKLPALEHMDIYKVKSRIPESYYDDAERFSDSSGKWKYYAHATPPSNIQFASEMVYDYDDHGRLQRKPGLRLIREGSDTGTESESDDDDPEQLARNQAALDLQRAADVAAGVTTDSTARGAQEPGRRRAAARRRYGRF